METRQISSLLLIMCDGNKMAKLLLLLLLNKEGQDIKQQMRGREIILVVVGKFWLPNDRVVTLFPASEFSSSLILFCSLSLSFLFSLVSFPLTSERVRWTALAILKLFTLLIWPACLLVRGLEIVANNNTVTVLLFLVRFEEHARKGTLLSNQRD